MKLAFSTLGCPTWTFDEILTTAQQLGYDGIEFRGLLSEVELDRTPEFSPAHIAETRKRLEDAGLAATCLSSSVQIVAATRDIPDQHRAVASAQSHIDMAKEVNAPFVRLFCGNVPADMPISEAEDRAIALLRRIGDYAQERDVIVAVETHDAYTDSVKLSNLIRATAHPAVQILWDIHHPYRISGEGLMDTWEQIGKFVRYTHLKDSVMNSETEAYAFVPIGHGDVPLREALHTLSENGYNGFLTFEWEKRWHPELDAPEVVFPQYIEQMRTWLAGLPA